MDYEVNYDAAKRMTLTAIQLCADAEEYRDRGCCAAARAASRAANLLLVTANQCDPGITYTVSQESQGPIPLQARIEMLLNVGF
jgi:hypothetical protein